MKELLFFIIIETVGITLIILRKSFAALCVRDQNKLWGFQFGAREKRTSEVIAIIAGASLIIMGLLCLIGIIRVK